MTEPSYPLQPLGYDFLQAPAAGGPRKRRLWLHFLLFALTLVTTLAVGAQFEYNYALNRPAFDLERDLNPFSVVWGHPEHLLSGIPFSLALLAILLAHEMGHYLTCLHYGIDATLPYFIPAPTIIGTMGAFIRIRSPIRTRRALFDVGVSGPLAGFALALPILIYGVATSHVGPVEHSSATVTFGNPLLIRFLEALFFPGVPPDNVYLSPLARAAWVGLFATALNLLPIGQLDGGHILYALVGDSHRRLSRAFTLVLLPLAYFYWYGWALWAVVLFFLGRHPNVWDPVPLDRPRRWLAALALVVFVLCFMPDPFTA